LIDQFLQLQSLTTMFTLL